MPFNSESLSTQSPQDFCLALKAARERKGITLSAIANTTKVPSYMFAALERGDLRRWPKGLFRRSFFRGYVGMIGLPVAETCAEFVQLFPDREFAPVAPAAGTASEATPSDNVRLVFDAGWHGPRAAVLPRVLAALLDAGAVLVAAELASAAGMDRSLTTVILALAYFSLATVLFGESPAKWAMSRRRSILDALTQGPVFIAAEMRRGIADAIAHLIGSAGVGTHEPVEEPEIPSRLRVRIKVSQ